MNPNLSHRLKLIRKLRGMSMDMLVSRIGGIVSKMAISKYERSVMYPSGEVLFKIANACGVTVDFFNHPHVDIGKISYRFFEDHPAEVASLLTTQIQELLDQYIAAEDLTKTEVAFSNPLKDFIVNEFCDVESAVTVLRSEWQLGIQPIVSVYETLQLHGVRVVEFYYEDSELNGLSTYVNGIVPFVLINTFSNKTVERKRFTALHELGHLLLNNSIKKSNTDYDKMIEKIVNRFAGAMLLSGDVAFNRIGKKREDITLKELISIKNLYGISISALNYRLYALDIISYEYRNHIFNDVINSNVMEKGWGGFPIPEVADRLSLIEERIKINSWL